MYYTCVFTHICAHSSRDARLWKGKRTRRNGEEEWEKEWGGGMGGGGEGRGEIREHRREGDGSEGDRGEQEGVENEVQRGISSLEISKKNN